MLQPIKRLAAVFAAAFILTGILSMTATAEITGGNFGTNDAFSWAFDSETKTLTISGAGAMPNMTAGGQPWAAHNAAAETLVIGEGITKVGQRCFSGMSALKNVTYPTNALEFVQYAFENCTALEAVTIPGNVTTVASRQYSGCTSLKTVVMEEGVRLISTQVFNGCSNLEQVVIPKSAEIATTGQSNTADGNLFRGANFDKLKVTVYKDTLNYNTAATRVNGYTYVQKRDDTVNIYNIKPNGTATTNYMTAGGYTLQYEALGEGGDEGDPSEKDGAGTAGSLSWTYTAATGMLAFSGEGAVPDYSDASAQPWAVYQAKVTKIVLGEGVSSLGKNSFANMVALTDLEIPSSVTTIGMYALSGCKSLETLIVPGTVGTVAARAFQNCLGLRHVEFEEGIGKLGSQLFIGCTGLESVVIARSAVIDRTHINYTTDGVWFRGISDFSKLTVYVYPDSDAYEYVTKDIYTITNRTNNPEPIETYPEVPNYMTNGGYVLKYALLGGISLSYYENTMTATIVSPERRTADLLFASYDNRDGTLLDVELQKEIALEAGITSFTAQSFAQKAGTTTKVMLLDSLDTMQPLCPAAEVKLKINIYMAGDSIMRPYTQEADYPQQGWGVPFAALFDSEEVEVQNYARGGSTTKSFYEMDLPPDGTYGPTGYGHIKRKIRAGDYLVVGFVHNDYGSSMPIAEYKEYLQKYIDEARAVGATPLFVVQPPRGTATNEHGDFPKAMMEVAEENGVFCADTDTPLRAQLDANLTEAQDNYWLFRLVERGVLTQEQLDAHNNLTLRDKGRDPTHISESGAAWVANFVAAEMKKAGILSEYITLTERP